MSIAKLNEKCEKNLKTILTACGVLTLFFSSACFSISVAQDNSKAEIEIAVQKLKAVRN
ncbi:TPA: hypothetical protein ACN35C_002501 [Vibrio parahaemolyticus]